MSKKNEEHDKLTPISFVQNLITFTTRKQLEDLHSIILRFIGITESIVAFVLVIVFLYGFVEIFASTQFFLKTI